MSESFSPMPTNLAGDPTWLIDELDVFGVPRSAHCSLCGYLWERPAVDIDGGTLAPAARAHHYRAHRTPTHGVRRQGMRLSG